MFGFFNVHNIVFCLYSVPIILAEGVLLICGVMRNECVEVGWGHSVGGLVCASGAWILLDRSRNP